MRNSVVWAAGVAALLLFSAALAAEVPAIPKDELEREAELIVTGKVTKVVAVKPAAGAKVRETKHRITLEVAKVEKGKPKDGAKTVVAVGSTYELEPGRTGSGGHYAGNASVRISAVKEGWELKLYLKAGKDGEYDIVFPNGFEVLNRPDAKKEEGNKGGGK